MDQPRNFFFQLHGIWRVELDPEAQHHWVDIWKIKDKQKFRQINFHISLQVLLVFAGT
jgi:hypothetical protein